MWCGNRISRGYLKHPDKESNSYSLVSYSNRLLNSVCLSLCRTRFVFTWIFVLYVRSSHLQPCSWFIGVHDPSKWKERGAEGRVLKIRCKVITEEDSKVSLEIRHHYFTFVVRRRLYFFLQEIKISSLWLRIYRAIFPITQQLSKHIRI